MDVIAKRVKARNLEVEGKLQEALDVYRDILAHEPTSEQLLPIAVQASELSVILGDREAGVAMLLAAADRYADAGLGWQVIDLHQRIRRLDPSRKGLDLRLARRMLERRHPQAAREFLADLARRFKKEKLRQMLARMEGWSDDEVQRRLLAFLDRAAGIRESTTAVRPAESPPGTPPVANPVEPVRRTAPGQPIPSVPETAPSATTASPRTRVPASPDSRQEGAAPTPAAGTGSSSARTTAPRRAPRDAASVSAGPRERPAAEASPTDFPEQVRERPRIPSEPVVFVTPAAPEPEPVVVPSLPPRFHDRRRKPSRIPSLAVAAVVIVSAAAGGLFLGMRLGGGRMGPRPVADTAVQGPAAGPQLVTPALAEVPPMAPGPADSAPATAPPDHVAADGAVSEPGQGTAATAPAPPPTRETRAPARTPASGVTPAVATTAGATLPRPGQASPPPPPAVSQQQPRSAPPAENGVPTALPAAAPPPAQPTPSTPTYGVDFPFVMVEGLEIVDITAEGAGAAQRVVVKQVLPSGETIELSASNLGASSVGLGGGRLLVSRHPSGGAMGTVRVGRHLVSARAPVTPDVLEPFLRKLVEVEPS